MSPNAGGIDPYIKSQIEARTRPAVIKIKFLSYRSRYPDGLLIAIEGDDDRVVYSYWIRRCAPDLKYEFFLCGGKRGVRQLRNSLSADRSGADRDVFFFVDRDFDDLAGFDSCERVYMLDCYSVENYLVDLAVVEESIKCAYPGDGVPDTREAICSLFEGDYSRFLEVTTDINRHIFIARQLQINIDGLIPETLAEIASVKLGDITAIDKSPLDLIPVEIEANEDQIAELSVRFASLDPRSRHRGKYAYKFLRIWLDLLASEFRDSKLSFFAEHEKGAGKIKHDECSLGSLASRSAIPNGLSEFLNQSIAASPTRLDAGGCRIVADLDNASGRMP